MAILGNLQPANVFKFFEEMCAIPHGSYNTKAISNWCVDFAKQRGLEYYQDDTNNVIIKKPASAGYEASKPVIIQGHLDMVCEKDTDCALDMGKDPLELFVQGDLIGAKGTTLGGDDGIAVAMAMAVLDDDSLKHPPIEAVFTTEEETGMDGALNLDYSLLKGRTMINIDSEDEGVLTVGCAGGLRAEYILATQREEFDAPQLSVTISGLTGGHSGIMIDRGRANANVLMGRLLDAVTYKSSLRIASITGGTKDNAIPTLCTAVIAVKSPDELRECAKQMEATFKNEYSVTDPHLCVTVEPCSERVQFVLQEKYTDSVIHMLVATPNGVQEMSRDIKGLVQTSINLGIVKTSESCIEADFSIRSSVESQKLYEAMRLMRIGESIGVSMTRKGDYPGWEYRKESPLRDTMVNVFKEKYGREPKIEVIHAGLECGVFSKKLDGLDCVSFGPDMQDIHTPRERLSIASTQRTWEYLVAVLENLK
ncbi:MAG: aminoacyl-histidine dipeptidase [Clostridia bacterium]|nr:aminoacyl-histidine dipeptidase [Clostridia bacterium]NLS85476.1 aminoacyl-histidine dipeptidase [Oscillospiraceae bacterium]